MFAEVVDPDAVDCWLGVFARPGKNGGLPASGVGAIIPAAAIGVGGSFRSDDDDIGGEKKGFRREESPVNGVEALKAWEPGVPIELPDIISICCIIIAEEGVICPGEGVICALGIGWPCCC